MTYFIDMCAKNTCTDMFSIYAWLRTRHDFFRGKNARKFSTYAWLRAIICMHEPSNLPAQNPFLPFLINVAMTSPLPSSIFHLHESDRIEIDQVNYWMHLVQIIIHWFWPPFSYYSIHDIRRWDILTVWSTCCF